MIPEEAFKSEESLMAHISQGILETTAEASYKAIADLADYVGFHGTNESYGFYEEKIEHIKNCLMAFCMQVEIQKPENKPPHFSPQPRIVNE
jgi:hypothetical protein